MRLIDYAVQLNEEEKPVMVLTLELDLQIDYSEPDDVRILVGEMIKQARKVKDDRLG